MPFHSTFTLRAKTNDAYITVQPAANLNLAANRTRAGVLQQFVLLDGGSGSVALQARFNGRYVCAESAGASPLVANRTAIGPWEQFDFVAQGDGSYALRARVNGLYVTTLQGDLIASQASAATDGEKFIIQTNAPLDAIRWRVVQPHFSPSETVVAACTPQDYGAQGDGVTDDTDAFQDAASTVAALGGGVIFVPAAAYVFRGTLSIPDGVSLHGDWQDWTVTTNGLVGTLFMVYTGRGQANGTPFIFLNGSTALKGVSIWYPEQSPTNIVAYPYCIGEYGDNAIQNVILVNPYQGIQVAPPTGGAKHIFSTLIGSPLFRGLNLDMIADISHLEDVRFNPDVWPASHLPGAPAAGGPHAAWMRANGTAMRMLRIDGETCMDTFISGYKVGLESNRSTNGTCGATFYSGSISNCGTAVLASAMAGQSGLIFTRFNFDADIPINSQPANDACYLQFHSCQFNARVGAAVLMGGDWPSRMQFQNCIINGRLNQFAGTFSLVNCTLKVNPGQYHIAMGSTDSRIRAAVAGCSFTPARAIFNSGSSNRVILDSRRAIPNPVPEVHWAQVRQDYESRHAARTNLFIATDAPYGAKGDATTDDTAAIQHALDVAGGSGGGIVFLPPGKYKLLGSLEVPSGVELRGTYELRHRVWPGQDGKAKGAILQPYAHEGQPDGPPAVALNANSGLVGVTFSYESQAPGALTPFPPTVQGRGGNIYVVGVVSPNSWTLIDLQSYACTNHLIYMADGFGLQRGFTVGHGSSGSIVDCHANWTYWIDNYDSASCLGYANDADKAAVLDFIEHDNEAYVLGDCSELLVKDFWIFTRCFTRCRAENGRGPRATCLAHMCDVTAEAFRFEAEADCDIAVVNSTMAVFSDFGDVSPVGVVSTAGFQGRARLFNSALFARQDWDFIVGGGDIGFDLFHMFDHSINGGRVDGGVLHLVNHSSWIAYDQTFPVYQIAFGSEAGLSGKVSEVIGGSAANGVQYVNSNPANPVKAWANFPILSLVPTAPRELAAPALSSAFDAAGPALQFTWPGDIGYFDLWEATDIAVPAGWSTVTNLQVYSNDRWTVTIPQPSTNRFWRLHAP